MKAVVQRVKSAHVVVADAIVGQIDMGLLVLLGIAKADTEADGKWLAEKIASLRIFPDERGKMGFSVKDLNLQVLVVSQFTLYGDCQTSRRPDFMQAADARVAKPLYHTFICQLQEILGRPIPTGSFGDKMEVHMVGDGPVTLIIEKKDIAK